MGALGQSCLHQPGVNSPGGATPAWDKPCQAGQISPVRSGCRYLPFPSFTVSGFSMDHPIPHPVPCSGLWHHCARVVQFIRPHGAGKLQKLLNDCWRCAAAATHSPHPVLGTRQGTHSPFPLEECSIPMLRLGVLSKIQL